MNAEDVIQTPGEPLTPTVQRFAGSELGYDFSRVRVHTDGNAALSARAVNAEAYTVGQHIVFNRGAYRPQTLKGLHLLTHELTHVVQQRGVAAGQQARLKIGPADSVQEREAERVAQQVTNATFPKTRSREDATDSVRKQGVSNSLNWTSTDIRHYTSKGVVQRRNILQQFLGLFAGEDFDEATLHDYLRILDETGEIQGFTDSDNKARSIVNRWKRGNSPYVLTPQRIILLIREMQSGFTGNEDEQAILELLERAENHHLQVIFGSNGVNVASLNSDFHGDEWRSLQNFYQRRFRGGMQALLRGQVIPQGRAVSLGAPLGERSSQTPTHAGEAAVEAVCSIRNPANCHSYEDWIQQFQGLSTFQARSRHHVIGGGPAPEGSSTDPTADPAMRRPTVLHERRSFWPTDRFIDGPTDAWVRTNLPPHLVRTAYQLPSDCADIAIILRHVWLVAHRRTEVYRGWDVGAGLHMARSAHLRGLVRGPVTSATVGAIVRSYIGPGGEPIRSFETLNGMLHEGDVLVWEHQDRRGRRIRPSGGHAQTIVRIERDANGRITEIGVLQGNQPIGARQAQDIRRQEISRARQQARTAAEARGASERAITRAERRAGRRASHETPSVEALRAAPGRRIEMSTRRGAQLQDNEEGIWSFPTRRGRDVLLAAGPPAIGQMPAVRREREGMDVVRGLADWVPELRRATDLSGLQSIVEAALLETRGLIEGGYLSIAGAHGTRSLGLSFANTAGERLWRLAQRAATEGNRRAPRRGTAHIRDRDLYAEDLAEESHYRPLRHISGLIQRLGAESFVQDTRQLFSYLNTEFIRAARGMTGIEFQRGRGRRGTEIANVLLTGFDPYQFARQDPSLHAGHGNRPRQVEPAWGRWNPSGAAVLQLDGATVPAGESNRAAVEGMILPVSFRSFREGMLESAIGPALDRLDAAITLSMDPHLPPAEEPVIERFAVGVHRLNNRRMEPIPEVPGTGLGSGPMIIEARGDLPRISSEAGLPQTREVRGRRLPGSLRSSIRFRFHSAAEADRALHALSLPAQNNAEVNIDDRNALAIIMNTMERGVHGVGITFRVDDQTFQTFILRGSGGAFLSNEVAYRVLRLLSRAPQSRRPLGFHVHTQRGEPIPQEVDEPQDRRVRYQAVQAGRRVVRRLIRRLRAIIGAVARQVFERRRA